MLTVNHELIDEVADLQQSARSRVAKMTPQWLQGANGPKANSINNAVMALDYDPILSGALAYNEFTWEIVLTRDIPQLHIHAGQMLDDYTSLIMAELEQVWQITFADRTVTHGVITYSHEHTFNPMKDYLNDALLVWDGVRRINSFMHTFLGVEESQITSLIMQTWLVGAVTKVFEPDAKFDYVLDLVGGQGAGKTTMLEKLAVGYYTDQFNDFKDKDGYQNMLRSWIVNDDEMTATANSTFEELKKFISARTLEFRPAYGHNAVRRDKSFVVARTTNEATYLKDKTGERRFLPLLVNKKEQQKHPVTDLTDVDVQQIWGEAMSLYKNGANAELTQEQELTLKKHREQFMYIDETESAIEQVLQTWTGNFITSKQIGDNIGVSDLIKAKGTAKKIKYIMDNREDWSAGFHRQNGAVRRGWRKS